MNNVTIKTNGHRRELVSYWQLPVDVRAEFEYMVERGCEDDMYSPRFVLYRGSWYDTSDCEGGWNGMPSEFKGWDEYASDSAFSGVLFRFPHNEFGEYEDDLVVVGTYYA